MLAQNREWTIGAVIKLFESHVNFSDYAHLISDKNDTIIFAKETGMYYDPLVLIKSSDGKYNLMEYGKHIVAECMYLNSAYGSYINIRVLLIDEPTDTLLNLLKV